MLVPRVQNLGMHVAKTEPKTPHWPPADVTPSGPRHNYGMPSEQPMPPILQVPPKVDLLKHFARHCAAVKLLALLLMVLMRWGEVALLVGIPTGVGLLVAQRVMAAPAGTTTSAPTPTR